MTIQTYINNSDNKKLNKDLTLVETLSNCIIKENTSVKNIVLILSRNTNKNFNYVHIPALSRYYFVSEPILDNQRTIYNCKCDVLMSFKNTIKELDVIASRSSNIFNVYQNDSELPKTERRKITTQPFPNGFTGQSILLGVTGG